MTYYDLLGVSITASEDEIRDAENALRKLFQPRAQQGDAAAEAMLRQLNDAHETLFDPDRRTAYDHDPRVLARALVDVAYPLPLGRYTKLAQIAAWLDEDQRTSDAAIAAILESTV